MNQLKEIFFVKLNKDVPDPEVDLLKSGLLDSLAFLNLIQYIEQEFGVRVSLENLEFDNFKSIAKLAEFIIERKSNVS